MNEIKKYITLKGGLTCKAVLQYDKPIPQYTGDDINNIAYKEYLGTEANNPTLPIATSTPMEEGGTFSGYEKEIWQYQHRGMIDWSNAFIEKGEFNSFEEFANYMYTAHDNATREITAIEPIQTVQEDNFEDKMDNDAINPYKPLPTPPNKEVERPVEMLAYEEAERRWLNLSNLFDEQQSIIEPLEDRIILLEAKLNSLDLERTVGLVVGVGGKGRIGWNYN